MSKSNKKNNKNRDQEPNTDRQNSKDCKYFFIPLFLLLPNGSYFFDIYVNWCYNLNRF